MSIDIRTQWIASFDGKEVKFPFGQDWAECDKWLVANHFPLAELSKSEGSVNLHLLPQVKASLINNNGVILIGSV